MAIKKKKLKRIFRKVRRRAKAFGLIFALFLAIAFILFALFHYVAKESFESAFVASVFMAIITLLFMLSIIYLDATTGE